MLRNSIIFYILTSFLFLSCSTFAQDLPRRDEPAYNVSEIDFDWFEIEDFGRRLDNLQDNTYQGPFDIGFEFPFFGNIYREFYISSNGLIGFGPTFGYNSPQN